MKCYRRYIMKKIKAGLTLLCAAAALFSVAFASFDNTEYASAYSGTYSGVTAYAELDSALYTWMQRDILNTYEPTGGYYWSVIDKSSAVKLGSRECALSKARSEATDRVYYAANFGAYYRMYASVMAGYYAAIFDVKMGEYDVNSKKHMIESCSEGVQSGYAAVREGIYDEFSAYIEGLISAECGGEITEYVKSAYSDAQIASGFKSVFDEYYKKHKDFFSAADTLSELEGYYSLIDVSFYEEEWLAELKERKSEAERNISSATDKEAALKEGKEALDKVAAKYSVTKAYIDAEEKYPAAKDALEKYLSDYTEGLESGDAASLKESALSVLEEIISFYEDIEGYSSSLTDIAKNYSAVYGDVAAYLTDKRDYFIAKLSSLAYDEREGAEELYLEGKECLSGFVSLYEKKISATEEIEGAIEEKTEEALKKYISEIESIYEGAKGVYSSTELKKALSAIEEERDAATDYCNELKGLSSTREKYLKEAESAYNSSLYKDGIAAFYEEAKREIAAGESVAAVREGYEKFALKIKAREYYEALLKGAQNEAIREAVQAKYGSLYEAAVRSIESGGEGYEEYVSSAAEYLEAFREEYEEKIISGYGDIFSSFPGLEKEIACTLKGDTPDGIYSAYLKALGGQSAALKVYEEYTLPQSFTSEEKERLNEGCAEAILAAAAGESASLKNIAALGELFGELNGCLGEGYESSSFSYDGNEAIKEYRLGLIDGLFSSDDFLTEAESVAKNLISLNVTFNSLSGLSLTMGEENAVKAFKAAAVKKVCDGGDTAIFKEQTEYIVGINDRLVSLKKILCGFFTEGQADAILSELREGAIEGVCLAESGDSAKQYSEKIEEKYSAFSRVEGEKYSALKDYLDGDIFTDEEKSAIEELYYSLARSAAESDETEEKFSAFEAAVEAADNMAKGYEIFSKSSLTDSEKALITTYRGKVKEALSLKESAEEIKAIGEEVYSKAEIVKSLSENLTALSAITLTDTESGYITVARLDNLTTFFTYGGDNAAGELINGKIAKIVAVCSAYEEKKDSFSEEEQEELNGYRKEDISSICSIQSAEALSLGYYEEKGGDMLRHDGVRKYRGDGQRHGGIYLGI